MPSLKQGETTDFKTISSYCGAKITHPIKIRLMTFFRQLNTFFASSR